MSLKSMEDRTGRRSGQALTQGNPIECHSRVGILSQLNNLRIRKGSLLPLGLIGTNRSGSKLPFLTLRHSKLRDSISRPFTLKTKRTTSLRAELFQHLANLFQVTLLVVTNEVNSRSAVNPAEKGMIENQGSKTFRAMQIAKVLQRLSRAIVICQHLLFLRHVDGFNRLRRLKLSNAQRDDRRRQESFEKTYASRFGGDPACQIFNDAFLDQIKMLQYLSDAPFPIGRPLP